MEPWVDQIEFERLGPLAKAAKKLVVNPLANHLPASWWKKWLADGQSDLARANWANPGGWESMVISYEGKPQRLWDRILVKGGTMPIALRNRRKLAIEIIRRMIRERDGQQTNIVCLGAGPGMIVLDAIERSGHPDCRAYMIDLNPASFEFGRKRAEAKGLAERVRFIQGNVVHYRELCDATPHIVKLIGICEYLDDATVADILRAIRDVMPAGGRLLANSLTLRHGTDAFFRRVFGLHMIHRSADQIRDLLAAGGFDGFEVFDEPLGVYQVVVAQAGARPNGEGR